MGIHINRRVIAVWITYQVSLSAGMKFTHISNEYVAPPYNLQSAMYLPLNATQYIQDEPDQHRNLFLVFSPTMQVQLPVGFPITPNVHVEKLPAQVILPPYCHLCKITGGCNGEDEYCSIEHGWCDLCNPPLPPGMYLIPPTHICIHTHIHKHIYVFITPMERF